MSVKVFFITSDGLKKFNYDIYKINKTIFVFVFLYKYDSEEEVLVN